MYLKNISSLIRKFSSVKSSIDEAELRSLCRKLSLNLIAPQASNVDQNSKYPKEQIDELGKLGLMGMTAPSEYGGCGLDMKSVALVVEELSHGCASTGAIVSIHNILFVDLLANHGTKQQKEKYLRPFTSGIPGSFALSESNAGSDVANISTTAVKKGDNYILNGTKSWVTSAHEAHVAIIFATVDKNEGHKGITGFIVPLNADGVSLSVSDKKLGIKGVSTCEINLSNVEIPKENIIGDIGAGFKIAMNQLNKARIGIASQALGISQACVDLALDYAENREAFGKNIVELQAVQLRLARMFTKTEAARLMIQKAADLCSRNQDFIKYSSMSKLLASEAATFTSHQCIQIMGAMGYLQCMPAERFYRDARVTEIYGGVTDIQLLIIADQLRKEKRLGKEICQTFSR